MAQRRVLGSSSKYIQNYGRLIGSHGRSVSTPTPTNTKKQEFDYHMDLGGLGPARFATQEFNRLKNAQLQISRVLKATCRHMRKELWRSPGYYYQRYYELVLEAVDADEAEFYQAQVAVDSVDDIMWLEVFCVMDEHYSLRLYHHLDNFFDE
ncbi:hypothetical protein ACFX13_020081 [Malus domestica]|uniref:uncharacterized protein n=1 Tax=Malus domestica TaxID=3750 RepID=UPI0010A9AD50|nr:uncharacterized protein LOC103401978 [Malus domestica]XP_028950361.1 uncharacterized protein LOC103401978 [Malus domestica]XP_028950362.1 uncharacterized protein LOC103401978 [Malus domestica]